MCYLIVSYKQRKLKCMLGFTEHNNVISKIVANDHCTGCSNCVDICPSHCLELVRDAAGFNQTSYIENKSCIDCGLCLKICPETSVSAPETTVYPECFAAWHKNPDTVKRSSSGGAFSALAETVIESGGVVAGVILQNNRAIYKLADTIEQLKEFCGSKYIPAELNDIIHQVENFLVNGKTVLFPALPCLAEALRKRFTGKNFPGILYTVDLVCAGVPSPAYFQKEMQKRNVEVITFRNKSENISWHKSVNFLVRSRKNQKVFSILPKNSPFYNAFLCGQIMRNSCYSCRHAHFPRPGDVTIADFWGEIRFPEQQQHGISMIFANNRPGRELLEKASAKLVMEPANLIDAANKNPRLYFGIKPQRDYLLRKLFPQAMKYLPLWLLNIFYGGGYRRMIFGKLPYKLLWRKKASHRKKIEQQQNATFEELKKKISQ